MLNEGRLDILENIKERYEKNVEYLSTLEDRDPDKGKLEYNKTRLSEIIQLINKIKS
jgi:hypothetical protein